MTSISAFVCSVGNYVQGVEGLEDLGKVADYGMQWAKRFTAFSSDSLATMGRYQTTIAHSRAFFTFCRAMSSLDKMVRGFFESSFGQGELQRQEGEEHVSTTSALSLRAVSWVNNSTEMASTWNELELIRLGKLQPYVEGVFHITTLLGDGAGALRRTMQQTSPGISTVERNYVSLKVA